MPTPREVNPSNGYFSMGGDTLRVPIKLFAENRRRLVNSLKNEAALPEHPVILLEGGQDQGICAGDSSDVGPIFKQEGYFHWAFGVLEPDCYGAIDVESGNSILFVPKLPDEYRIWMGPIPSLEEWKQRYEVDEAVYIPDMKDYLWNLHLKGSSHLLVLDGINSDSKKQVIQAAFDGISEFKVNKDLLFDVFAECRVIKSETELEVMRYATRMSCEAHKAVMKMISPGMREYQCEAAFLNHIYLYGGMRHVCYNCICGSGSSGAVLHYGHAGAPNDQPIRQDDMVLFDMGGEYYRYCSDVTCSYPANGVFSLKQKLIYNAVLKANRAVLHTIRPGVSYKAMHELANRVILEDLLDGGLLKGSVEDMMKVNLCGRVFQPHGLGHFIGCDVHDVGGYLDGHPERPEGLGLGNLRTARVLKSHMCLTIEPGCYFIDYLLDKAYETSELSQFLVKDKIEEFRGFGGVRIEDDVIITETGVELMSLVPRAVEEIEAFMRGEDVKIEAYKS
ncbi:xaa-Pro dipeptidase [Lepeophtheirus salmonis]|uniref:xaa-Pro dipeptidase n=1 Tax=Lepeophtheirus salmonis TaxID=72036 RepID=UPI001AE715A8|nr:xaa-Pro dipeptidase-like [Lepeophtheirus salmonis]XP_040582075.1 xaa-Pro dipeptidase-like [Lepeophtheirus salmonis]XP_040582082.1 xaa-Pro dipeptidase-like [Lepeophtheirus salmonis]